MIQFPVTVLHQDRPRLPPVPVLAWADTAVASENNGLMFVKPLNRSMDGAMVRVDSEGTAWVHGHHRAESPEVRAMIAAWALGRL